MKIYLHQCSPKGLLAQPLSLLIKRFQKTNYSHWAMSFEVTGDTVPYDERYFFEAGGKGVIAVDGAEFIDRYDIKKTYIYADVKLSEAQFYAWYVPLAESKYSYLQLVVIMLRLMGAIDTRPTINGPERFICSELCGKFIDENIERCIKESDFDTLDLNELEKICEKHLRKGLCYKVMG